MKCSKCGCEGLHACMGKENEAIHPEKEEELRKLLEEAFIGYPTYRIPVIAKPTNLTLEEAFDIVYGRYKNAFEELAKDD